MQVVKVEKNIFARINGFRVCDNRINELVHFEVYVGHGKLLLLPFIHYNKKQYTDSTL